MNMNKDKTGNDRQNRLREARAKWLSENAFGLSFEGLMGALIRGDCVLRWINVPKKLLKKSSDVSERED